MTHNESSELASNRRATFNFEIIETYEAGIVLTGTEVKSLRDHGGHLQDSYVKAHGQELWLCGCSIAPYRFGNIHNHEEKRERKLLLHFNEIQKLKAELQEKGLSVIPLALYLKKGKVKVKLGVGRGKRHIDKRASIKEREEKRHMARAMRHH